MKVKHAKNLFNVLATAVVVFSIVLIPTATLAFYSDMEIFDDSELSASSLDISLQSSNEDDNQHAHELENVGDLDTKYLIELELFELGQEDFCDDLQVKVKKNGMVIHDGSLSNFNTGLDFIDVDEVHNFEYEFSVDDTEYYAGSCRVDVVYKASQSGFGHGEAFYDTEIDSIVLFGSNFGTEPLINPPTNVCDDGGWESPEFAEFNFNNYGHCVSHFASDGQSTESRNKNKDTENSPEVLGEQSPPADKNPNDDADSVTKAGDKDKADAKNDETDTDDEESDEAETESDEDKTELDEEKEDKKDKKKEEEVIPPVKEDSESEN